VKQGSKDFFSEEKKQKTFISWCSRQVTLPGPKVFWFFFSKKNILAFLSAAALPAISGCDLAPGYKLPLTAVPVSYKEASAFEPARPLDTFSRGAWWTVFGDPTLNELESRVDTGNPTLAAARAELQRARAFAAEARAGLFPSLSVGGHINTDRQSARRPLRSPAQPSQYLDNAIDAQAHYEVDLWDRVANSIKASRFAAQATAADLETERLSLHAELASEYMELRSLDAQARVLENAVSAYAQAVHLTQNRFAGKIASIIDVSRAEAQLGSAEAQLTDIKSRRALTEHAIAVLTGRQPAELSLPAAEWKLGLPDISPGLPSQLLERRPDVASAERQMAAANATIGVARAVFYPTLSLDMIYGLQDTGFNMFTLPDQFWALGPGVALPLFEGGLRNAEEAAAIAAYRLALANYRATVLAAFQEVEDALAQQRLLAAEAGQEGRALAASRQTLAADVNLYKDGATNFLDVVIAQAEELHAEQADIDLRTRRVLADLSLVRALGGGWDVHTLPDFKHGPLLEASRGIAASP
jgi:NodT family efflux transporter outer membrane factor (OMF) lipoprotein